MVPERADFVVVGGGTAGAAVAARLVEAGVASVLLLEAGPDYGPLADGHWPAELLDTRALPVETHDWGYVSASELGRNRVAIPRARVLGGCSAHNGCSVVWGHRSDYDGWAAAGCSGWGMDELLPLFRDASARLRAEVPPLDELTPFQRAHYEAAVNAGYRACDDLNDPDFATGVSRWPVNIVDGSRFNTAFGYLDPVRDDPALTVVGNASVERLLLDGRRVTGLEVTIGADTTTIDAGTVILCAGAYGTPLILLRSGIGPTDELAEHGIDTALDLPGVGRNLLEHPALVLQYASTPEFAAEMAEFERSGGLVREDGIVTRPSTGRTSPVYDLQLYAVSSRAPDATWAVSLWAVAMVSKSRGSVRLGGPRVADIPIIDHAYLADPEGCDLAVLADGVALLRELAAQPALARFLGEEVLPGEAVACREAIEEFVRSDAVHDYHPVGTCRMGPDDDAWAVVDPSGCVRGLEDLRIADASIMPTVPRANTNLPSLVMGERVVAAVVQELVRTG